uniref:Putative ovule protein n=1 Tax=Solanum chacoense TaxID=4108 RepID=A0A0V0HJL6_SOLCH
MYLGMPLGVKSKAMNIWNSLIEKYEKKLTRWKSQYTSLGDRVTFINSVLDALLTYMMSIFPIPDGVIESLDKIRRDFLWKGSEENVSTVRHLVKWNEVLWGLRQD